ncbi:hypothetical protein RR48_14798 [Papilio machaon]|uniref:Uncharacterized protein n=1 Tax=Papilio machaon TaxID=76193 RepID=A0A194R0X2_PAPMA|nr:hypothetical protein RR48_14798 [Papilio machaon]
MIVIGMGALYVQTRPRQKNRSPFFFSWTLSSGVWMFLVFEIAILRLLEITQLEHFIFLVLLACTCYSFYKVKAIADFELATGSSKGKEYRLAISFVCCIYGLGYLCVVTLILIRHLFVFIPKYMAPQWKKLVNPTV